MAGQKIKSARTIAVEVLNRCDPKKNYAGTILDSLRHETDQGQRATDLVFGTLRNRRAIDTVITTFSGRPVKRIQGSLLNIIRIGTYELIYCPSTEQYAIVDEAVASAKATGSTKQAGFVNAVLRQVARHISNRQVSLLQADDKSTLPQTPVTGCQFDTAFLPESETRPSEYLSTAFSLPKWLVAGWLAEFGEESTRQICFASNRRPSIYLRPNLLKTTMEILTQKLRDADLELEVNTDDSVIRIVGSRAISELPGFAQGEFSVQDVSASKPVSFLNPQSGMRILDLCAAPGTKTTQLAEATGDSAKIIATDIDKRRLKMVKENVARLGIQSVDVVTYDELFSIVDSKIVNRKSKIANSFDCILLDVPCSNTGVLARRVEARYRIKPESIRELARIQGGLIRTAAEMIKPGGLICYSTCSIQKAENSQQIEDFLKTNQNFTLESEQLTLPSAEGFRRKASCGDHDGGYVAILTNRKIVS